MKTLPAVFWLILLIDAALAGCYALDHLLGKPIWIVSRLIDLDLESNIPTWYSSVKLYSIALLFGAVAYDRFERSRWDSWLLAGLPLLFLAMSADEVAEVHEWLGGRTDVLLPEGDRSETFFQETGIWMFVIGLPFLVLVMTALHLLRGVFRCAPGSLTLLAGGLLILLAGAIGIETLSNLTERGTSGHVLQTLFEELFEMVGATFMLAGALVLARAHGVVGPRLVQPLRRDPIVASPLRGAAPEFE